MSQKQFIRTLPDWTSIIRQGAVEASNICQTRICFPNKALISLPALHHESL